LAKRAAEEKISPSQMGENLQIYEEGWLRNEKYEKNEY
jgi:hypothetical protein